MAIGGGRGRGSSGGSVGADRDKSGGVRGRDGSNASGGGTNEQAKRMAPRMDVPVSRTVDTAPRGMPQRSSNPNQESVPSYPFSSPWRGVINMFESLGPLGPVTAPAKQAFGMTLGDTLGLESGPRVGNRPTQTRSNIGYGSGVGGSANSGGALPNRMGAFRQPQPMQPMQPQQPQIPQLPQVSQAFPQMTVPRFTVPQGFNSRFGDQLTQDEKNSLYARMLT